MSVVETRGLRVSLGGREVLKGADLSLDEGRLVGLLGPNGAGKTTLMRSLLGLVPIDSGEIRIAGKTQIDARRASAGYVPQRHDVAWSFPMSVHQTVLSGRVGRRGWFRRAGAADYRACADALQRVEMDHLADRPIGELSGGQRQRVLIARALARGPRVLLLDEPFTGLDMPTQEVLSELFIELARSGETLLMSTHDLVGAQAICDRIVLLRETVIAEGAVDEVRDVHLWARAFQVRPESPLLSGLGLTDPAEPADPAEPHHSEETVAC